MDIKKLRKEFGYTKKDFCDRFEIPYSTLRNWEMGISKCPIYIENMISNILSKESAQMPKMDIQYNQKMINSILKKDIENLTREETTALTTAIIQQCLTEFNHHDRGGLYGYLQRSMAYNSNRIEGNRLTEDETALLFETGEILSTGETIYRSKDIEEMSGHFLMFNQMLKTVNEDISEEMIKNFHYQLEAGVFEFRANGYIPGEYKQRENTVGGIQTSHPKDVRMGMLSLLEDYRKLYSNSVNLSDLSALHAKYEKIHPFQDGNGRTGRMILMRECLHQGIMPFIVQDENKAKYYVALKKYQTGEDFSKLTEYFEAEQKSLYDKLQHYMYNYACDKSVFNESQDTIDIEL